MVAWAVARNTFCSPAPITDHLTNGCRLGLKMGYSPSQQRP